jgi:hypothetical protein
MTMTQEKTDVAETHALIGREALSHLRQQGEGALAAEAALANYPYTGQAVITIFLIGGGTVQVTANFDTGDKLQYNATIFGPIAGGGGISFGGGAFDLSPGDLLKGPMGCTVHLTPVGVIMTFIRDEKIVGSFFGGGPNIGAGHAGGSGDWKRL